MTAAEQAKPKFVTGSTMRHVVVMTATGSLGLVAVFFVDLANLFYISLLGAQELAAAIGYAGTILFFNISVCIGVTIGATALISRALGAGDRPRARRLATSALIFMTIVTVLAAAIQFPLIGSMLSLLGAEGETYAVARGFMQIVLPSLPLMGLGMCLSGVLRAVGDAKRAMYVTLAAAIASAVIDPLLIFGADLGVNGAAIATVLSRCVLALVGWHGAARVHDMIGRLDLRQCHADISAIGKIAVPAILTNVATPVGNAVVTATIAPFGDDAVAGWAVIGRIIPVAFGAIFALSGAVGPILGQNLGAGHIDRVQRTMRDSLVFIIAYTTGVWLVLVLMRNVIVDVFGMHGAGAELVVFFCVIASIGFLFNGALFVANAAFNNLGFPLYSTLFNWGRATLGTLPFVWLGARIAGAEGVLAGQALGSVLFGVAALVTCFRVIKGLDKAPSELPPPPLWRAAQSPFTSGKGASAG